MIPTLSRARGCFPVNPTQWNDVAHQRRLDFIFDVSSEIDDNMHALHNLIHRIQHLPKGRDCRSTLSRYNFYYEIDCAGHDCLSTHRRVMRYMEHICSSVISKKDRIRNNAYDDDLCSNHLMAQVEETIQLLRDLRDKFDYFIHEHNKSVRELLAFAKDLDARECFGCSIIDHDDTIGRNERLLFHERSWHY